MSKEKAIITTPKSAALAAAEEIPEFLRSQLGQQKGMENVDQTDILIPRLGLCQALSPQKRKSHPLYIEGLKEGDLFNSVTQEIYGESVDIVILFFFKNRIKFKGISEGGGIDCISTNGVDGGRIAPTCAQCKFSQWGNGAIDDEHANDSPSCTGYHNYMAFVIGENSPIAFSFKSTGLKSSKTLLAQIRLTRLPMYAKTYKINVTEVVDGSNQWWEKKLVPTGFVDKEQFDQMESLFKSLKAANIAVDTRGEEGSSPLEDSDTGDPIPF